MSTVTLTSDFGSKDYLAGAFKGRLLREMPGAALVDISHDIAPFNLGEAAYIMGNSLPQFPLHTCHLLLVNLLDQDDTYPLLAFHKGHYYGSADNGLIPLVLGELPELAIRLPLESDKRFNILYWADAFGKAIRQIHNGDALTKLGTEWTSLRELTRLQAIVGRDYIEGRIIFIDRFENVVVNITRSLFDEVGQGRPFVLQFRSNESISRLHEGYPQVSEGSKLAFFNAAGYLEIAVNKGNAASLFGLQTYDHHANPEFLKSRMYYQTVRIHFQS